MGVIACIGNFLCQNFFGPEYVGVLHIFGKFCWGTTLFWGNFVGARHIFEKSENAPPVPGQFIYDRSLRLFKL